jgi:hypothetical protein
VRGVPVYGEVTFCGILPGTDLTVAAHEGSVETRFALDSDADPSLARFSVADPDGARLTTGEKSIEVAGTHGRFRFSNMRTAPTRAADPAASSEPVSAVVMTAYGPETDFEIAYSTYLGASRFDAAYAVASDPEGGIYLAGNTESVDFPVQNAYDPSYNYGSFGDVFVARVSLDDSSLVYSTFIGGSAADILGGLAVDYAGNAYISGITGSSATFPLVNAYDPTYGGSGDVFVCKLSPTGDQLLYSTFLGGIREDHSWAIAVDSAGQAFVTGHTMSHDFPVVSALQAAYGGGDYDAFVTKFSASGSSLIYSTYLGGSVADQAFGIAVDRTGCAYARGWTASSDFPVQDALDGTFNGGERDVFVSKLAASGSSLQYSTYIGGSDSDYGVGIVVDNSGAVYIGGATRSEDFPLQNAIDSTLGGLQDLFVAKLTASGNGFVFNTLLGGSAEDFNALVAIDACRQAYVAGYTYSTDFPMVDPFDESLAGGADVTFTGLSADGASLLVSSFLGGSGFEFPNGIMVVGTEVFIAGLTNSADFPVAASYDSTLNGDYDVFLTGISGASTECGCSCPCHGDPQCDGVRCTVQDVVHTVNVAFRGADAVIDVGCPRERTDVNCDGYASVQDVVKVVNVAFRGADPATDFCDPCP